MQHLDEGTIHAWLDGALDAEEAARVEQHAAECAACANAVAEARGLVAGASRILSALDDAPGGVVPRSATFADSRRARPARSLWGVLRMTPVRAAAAAMLIVAGGTTLVMLNRPNESRAVMSPASFPRDTNRGMVFAAPGPVNASPVPPTAAADSAAVGGGARGAGRGAVRGEPVRGGRPGNVFSAGRVEARGAMATAAPARAPFPVAVPPVAALATDTSVARVKVLFDKKTALADAAVDSTRRARRDSAIADSTQHRLSLEAVVVTSLPASAPRALTNSGVAGAAAPSARRSELRPVSLPSAVNYAGCYSVFGQGGLPSLLSLDNTQSGAESKVAAPAAQRALRFGISSVEANQRKIENGWWEPMEGGRRGVRISIDNRSPIVFTALGDSLVSAADSAARTPAVTLRRVNCPIR
ncbi:MAG TPA: zf-HC2 domain-containing protein [Gemmatimonadaceae bacterium]|jgi:hypothetical protein|nr:zf-HC2 domain-containing protein [Gemmatimonadaceae bacterium]